MINDRISDMITRLRNAYQAGKPEVSMPHTNVVDKIAGVLVEEKYLVSKETVETDGHKNLKVVLNYSGHKPALSVVKRISKPGVRIYKKTTAIRPVLSGMGLSILSTSQGIMTDRKAKKAKLGGEVLFELW